MDKFLLTKMNNKLPEFITNYGAVTPYKGPFIKVPSTKKHGTKIKISKPGDNKQVGSIREVLEKIEIKDGMTISFHHHLRNGDYVLNMVVDEIAAMGVRDISICASSLTDAPEPLIQHILVLV